MVRRDWIRWDYLRKEEKEFKIQVVKGYIFGRSTEGKVIRGTAAKGGKKIKHETYLPGNDFPGIRIHYQEKTKNEKIDEIPWILDNGCTD